MVNNEPSHDRQPEAYRDYLLLLARMWSPRRLQRKMDASDLVQDALVKAYAKRDQFKGDSSGQYKAWLRVTLKNTLLDAIDKFERRPEQSVCQVEEASGRLELWLAAEQPSPSEPVIRDEQLELLARFLTELPEDQQEVLVLKHCLGRKVAEIAEETGRSIASVAGLLRRGLKQLRVLFPEE
jgi:RNA polymerase sigma-70 factor (ECF subfamily)